MLNPGNCILNRFLIKKNISIGLFLSRIATTNFSSYRLLDENYQSIDYAIYKHKRDSLSLQRFT